MNTETDTPRTDEWLAEEKRNPRLSGLGNWLDYCKLLERELNAVTEQRDRLTKSIEPLKYWRDISECDCSNPLPQGGCLRCDLDRILNNQ
jgi:hypothetical protein